MRTKKAAKTKPPVPSRLWSRPVASDEDDDDAEWDNSPQPGMVEGHEHDHDDRFESIESGAGSQNPNGLRVAPPGTPELAGRVRQQRRKI